MRRKAQFFLDQFYMLQHNSKNEFVGGSLYPFHHFYQILSVLNDSFKDKIVNA